MRQSDWLVKGALPSLIGCRNRPRPLTVSILSSNLVTANIHSRAMASTGRSMRKVFKRRGQALTEWKRKCANDPANPEEGPLSGDDEVDAPLPTLRVADDLSCVPMPAADPIAEEDLMDEKLKDLLDEWMSAIPRDDKMMLCLVLFQLCRKEFKLGAIDADKTTRF